MLKHIIILFLFGSLVGCAPVIETSKKIWGSSTRSLEEARVNGIVRVYNASVQRCFEETVAEAKIQEYTVFIADKKKAMIVLMGVKGSVNTTRVGVFFSEVSDTQTKIYVTSLSTNAKRIVADKLYTKLDTVLGTSSTQKVTVIPEE